MMIQTNPRFLVGRPTPGAFRLGTILASRRTAAACAHLDARLREDAGLPRLPERPPLPGDIRTRLAMLAWR